jgi:hypothetical protein
MMQNALFFAAFVLLGYLTSCLVTPPDERVRVRARARSLEEESRR